MHRNILFITADQWRGDCLSSLGHAVVRTPNLDALAEQGALFRRHFVNTAPCGPSRASIHTGLYQRRHGVYFNGTPLARKHANWAAQMRGHGIAPVLFGYTDTVRDPSHPHVDASGDVLPGLEVLTHLGKSLAQPVAWMAWLEKKGYPIPAKPLDLYTARKNAAARTDEPPALAIPAELHDTWFMVDQVIDYIARQNDSWCVHLSLLRPHPPWIAPEPYNRLYPPDQMPPFVRAVDAESERLRHPYLEEALAHKHYRAPADEWRVRRWQASYFGLMTEVDDNLGRLWAFLKSSGAWHNTLIVFTSDHGEQMGDHWLIGKLGFFDQSFAVPLIVRNPLAAERGLCIDAFTEAVDIMPTLLDWLDVPVPAQCDGRSLLPITQAGHVAEDWRNAAQWEFCYGEQRHLSVRRNRSSKRVRFSDLPTLEYELAAQEPGRLSPIGD